MAFAKLSGLLLVRNDTEVPVSVPITVSAGRSQDRPLSNFVELSSRKSIDLPPPGNPKPSVEPVTHRKGVRLISLAVCSVAGLGAFGLLTGHYAEVWRALPPTHATAHDESANIAEGRTEAALLIPLSEPDKTSTSRHGERPTIPAPSMDASVSGTTPASPVGPATTHTNESGSAIVVRSPERGRGLSQTNAATLIKRGDAFFSVGDVASGRLFYQYAAEAGDGAAALRLGEAFDPTFLERARLGRIPGDVRKAIYWYLRARELGNPDAEILLNGAGYIVSDLVQIQR
jgi:hypothetical protein